MKQPIKIKFLTYMLLVIVSLGLFSCSASEGGAYHPNGAAARRGGIGEIDDIIVIADKMLWKTSIKDTAEYYFESPFLLLPHPEAVFRVKHFTYRDLLEKPLRKKFFTQLLLADMSDTASLETKMVLKDLGEEKIQKLLSNPKARFAIAKDKWIDNQLIIYLLGKNQEDLEHAISANFPAIAAKVRQHDSRRIYNRAFHNSTNKASMKLVKDTFGINLKVPADFIAGAIRNQELIWLRKETQKTSSSLLIARIPYSHESQLSADSLKVYFNALGKKYVASQIEGSFMQINDKDLPLIKNEVIINGQFAVENRGIWELENDYMGGPFISYMMQNPNNKRELILLAGFIYAPQKKKKRYVQDLEEIIRSVEF